MKVTQYLRTFKQIVLRAVRIVYWTTAVSMIVAGASGALLLVVCFTFPFLPFLLFFPLVGAMGSVGRATRGVSMTPTVGRPSPVGRRIVVARSR